MRKRCPLTFAPPVAGVPPRRAHVGTLQRAAVKVSEWVIYLAQVYDTRRRPPTRPIYRVKFAYGIDFLLPHQVYLLW